MPETSNRSLKGENKVNGPAKNTTGKNKPDNGGDDSQTSDNFHVTAASFVDPLVQPNTPRRQTHWRRQIRVQTQGYGSRGGPQTWCVLFQ